MAETSLLPPRSGAYMASKAAHAPRWLALRDAGFEISSSWIDDASGPDGFDPAELSVRCLRDIAASERLVLFLLPGDAPKGALLEAGAALALGVPVFQVGDSPALNRVFQAHPLWHRSDTLAEALGAPLARLAACEDVLRSLASHLGAGGYNAPAVDPAQFEAKILWGVDEAVRIASEMARRTPPAPSP